MSKLIGTTGDSDGLPGKFLMYVSVFVLMVPSSHIIGILVLFNGHIIAISTSSSLYFEIIFQILLQITKDNHVYKIEVVFEIFYFYI